MSTQTDSEIINPTCHACDGTGIDSAFGGDCSECAIDAGREALVRAAYAGVRTTAADRAYTPGERLDGRTFGSDRPTVERTPGGATVKAANFARKLIDERISQGDKLAQIVLDEGKPIDEMDGKEVSHLIDAVKAMPPISHTADEPKANRGNRSNRYGGECVDCHQHVEPEAGVLFKLDGRWATAHKPGECPAPTETAQDFSDYTLDLSDIPAGTYAVPGGETRLKVRIDKPTKGRWAGFIFVKDGAEYGNGKRYGRQTPTGRYVGDIEDELEAILADPAAAMAEYGHLTSRCGICGRTLEDEASVARGIGPVCAQKF